MYRVKRTSLMAAAMTIMLIAVVAAPAAATRGARHSESDVVWFADQETPVGSSHLSRTDGRAVGTFRTSGLAPREAITLWWVVFNNPAGCSIPCGEDDIFLDGDPTQGLNAAGIAAADIVAGYATGTVANRQGRAVMVAELREGAPVTEVIFGDAPALKDSHAAEIHLVARSHGPAVPELIHEQTGSYAGGCDAFLHPPAIPTEVGECADIQFAVHTP